MRVYLAAQVCVVATAKVLLTECVVCFFVQVMSETVASALQFVDEERTRETRQFIRMIDLFFDALNVKNPLEGKLKRKPFRLPYYNCRDERFKVSNTITMHIYTAYYTATCLYIL